ncbi:MAG: hypothetical protein GY929_24625 [Actinomycetia bacterium]|nr:hypothetical protein [Actinomycetes bacterium]
MALVRWVTEMGMGVDVHGRDHTKAAKRAVSDALRHSSLSFFGPAGRSHHDMHIQVMIGVCEPEAVDVEAIAAEVPFGTVTVTVVDGGLYVPPPSGDDGIAIANAAVLVSFDEHPPSTDASGGQ